MGRDIFEKKNDLEKRLDTSKKLTEMIRVGTFSVLVRTPSSKIFCKLPLITPFFPQNPILDLIYLD